MTHPITFGVHWWRYTTRCPADEVMASVGGEWSDPVERGAFNQPFHSINDRGVKCFFGSRVESQPVVVEVTGEVCERYHHEELASCAAALAGSVTRCDIAADVEPASDARSRLIEATEAFKAGRCETRMSEKSCEEWRSHEGFTSTFGGRQSELMLRMYDRRGPLRCEFEFKPMMRETKQLVPTMMIESGPAKLFRALAKRLVFPCPWWHELVDGVSAELSAVAVERASRQEFIDTLMMQFGPSLHALVVSGLDLRTLAVPFGGKLHAEQQAKFLGWSEELRRDGRIADAERLSREVKACQRRK